MNELEDLTPDRAKAYVIGVLGLSSALVMDVGENVLKLVSFEGDDIFLVISLDPPATTSELQELTQMDLILKRMLERKEIAPDIKLKVIAERRQIQKQLASIKASLNAGKNSMHGKLTELQDGEFEEN